MHSLGLSVNLALYAKNVGLPDCIGSSVRVTHIISEMDSLAAYITLCHILTSRRYNLINIIQSLETQHMYIIRGYLILQEIFFNIFNIYLKILWYN